MTTGTPLSVKIWPAFEAFFAEMTKVAEADYAVFAKGFHDATPPVFGYDVMGRYIRLTKADPKTGTNKGSFGFVDMTNGDVLKAATWKAPAKNFARGNINDEAKGCGRVRWTGVW